MGVEYMEGTKRKRENKVCVFTATLFLLSCVCLLGQSIKMFIRGRPITMYIPSNIQNYEDLKMEPPSERLELDWVYPFKIATAVFGL